MLIAPNGRFTTQTTRLVFSAGRKRPLARPNYYLSFRLDS